MALADRIDALLPQTQCQRCDYPDCRAYAQAIARDDAPINRCPPGGTSTIASLAVLLGRELVALDDSCGSYPREIVAVIDPERCIGCARCLPPCPTDAIVGAARYMHDVVATLCTGCELCIAACPVDCISMQPRPVSSPVPSPDDNRQRYRARTRRMEQRGSERAALLEQRKHQAPGPSGS